MPSKQRSSKERYRRCGIKIVLTFTLFPVRVASRLGLCRFTVHGTTVSPVDAGPRFLRLTGVYREIGVSRSRHGGRMRLTNRNSKSRRLKHRMFAATTTLTRRRDAHDFVSSLEKKSLSLSSYPHSRCKPSAESKSKNNVTNFPTDGRRLFHPILAFFAMCDINRKSKYVYN